MKNEGKPETMENTGKSRGGETEAAAKNGSGGETAAAAGFGKLSPDDQLKYEIAEELGLLEQVREHGWKSLSARETGRIGGLMTKKKRERKASDV